MNKERITATEALKKTSRKQAKYIYNKIKRTMKKGRNAFVELKLKFVPTQEVLLSLMEDGFYVEINPGYNDGKIYLYINWYEPTYRYLEDDEYEKIDDDDYYEEYDDDDNNGGETILPYELAFLNSQSGQFWGR